jgi:two-component system chemotaxis response regulator CheB
MHPGAIVANHDIVVIGASAGGVEAISAIVAELPADLRAAVLVVLHLSRGKSVFPEILNRVSAMRASHPADGEVLQYGRIYVAPPDHHMVVEADTVRVVHGPTENGVRPAIDPLFRSAARTYGPRVVAVVLTGSLDDGTAGMAAVKEARGVGIVQDPAEAFAPSMPRSALQAVKVDHILPLREIPLLISALTRETAVDARPLHGPHLQPMEPDLAEAAIAIHSKDRPGRVSVFSCPECHGTLWEADDGGILRFRCRVGHVYSPESMLAAQTDSVDRALWAALRSLEERAALTRRLSERARQRQHGWVSRAFDERARVAEEHASVVRALLQNRAAEHIVPDHSEDPEGPIVADEATADEESVETEKKR